MIRKLFERLSGKGDQVVFVSLSGLLLGSIVYLLMPQPQYTLQLTRGNPAVVSADPARTEALENTPPDEEAFAATAMSDTSALTSGSKTSHAHKGPKKPKVIPIVNINTAGLAELDLLPGVGPKMAARILQYRKGVGKFQTIEELTGVKGIGPKTFSKMKPYLRL